ncbi:hypothetical protein EOL96_00570 [Candidatus Saccharibacteria bacterium]|nr:hypothetical protein [Candidatus Saccharibacteria bacterium]
MDRAPAFLTKDSFKIVSLTSSIVDIPFNSPVYLPFGEIYSRPSLIIDAVVQKEDVIAHGFAEGASLPMQVPLYDDFSGNLVDNSIKIARALEGRTYTLRSIQEAISSLALGGMFATARMTVETSIIDAVARSHNQSVYSLLTGENDPVSISVPYGKSITEVDEDIMTHACREAVEAGAKRLKFKISPESFDVVYQTLQKLIRDYPDGSFMVDANGMFDVTNPVHVENLKLLDGLEMITIEEPVSRAGTVRGLDAHRALKELYQFKTPITIDDAIKSVDDAETALNEGLASVINLKPGRIGSFLQCIDIAHNAARHKKQIMVGGMFEATPGRYMTTTLAAYCMTLGFTIPGDLSLPIERLIGDIGDDRLSLDKKGGVMFTPKKGWGYDISQI